MRATVFHPAGEVSIRVFAFSSRAVVAVALLALRLKRCGRIRTVPFHPLCSATPSRARPTRWLSHNTSGVSCFLARATSGPLAGHLQATRGPIGPRVARDVARVS